MRALVTPSHRASLEKVWTRPMRPRAAACLVWPSALPHTRKWEWQTWASRLLLVTSLPHPPLRTVKTSWACYCVGLTAASPRSHRRWVCALNFPLRWCKNKPTNQPKPKPSDPLLLGDKQEQAQSYHQNVNPRHQGCSVSVDQGVCLLLLPFYLAVMVKFASVSISLQG